MEKMELSKSASSPKPLHSAEIASFFMKFWQNSTSSSIEMCLWFQVSYLAPSQTIFYIVWKTESPAPGVTFNPHFFPL